MFIKYTNRKGEIHYLKVVTTTKGAKRYYIVKNKNNVSRKELQTEIPKGFEFYESPEDGRVSFRKKQESLFSGIEKQMVSQILKLQKHIEDFIIDLEKDTLIIYIAHLKKSEFGFDLEHFNKIQSYLPKLIITKKSDNYQIQRFCNLSSHYGWITMETSLNLIVLCEKYFPHIGKESLLDFWIEGEKDW